MVDFENLQDYVMVDEGGTKYFLKGEDALKIINAINSCNVFKLEPLYSHNNLALFSKLPGEAYPNVLVPAAPFFKVGNVNLTQLFIWANNTKEKLK